MYSQIIVALAMTSSANALVAKARQAACSQPSGNITSLIQHAQGEITILEQTLEQNITITSMAAKNVDAALDAVYLSISTDKDEDNVCSFNPKSSSEQVEDTWANRNIELVLLQQVSSILQTVQQAVYNCDHFTALNHFCGLERFWINGDGADLTGVTTTSTGLASKTNGFSSTTPYKDTAPPASKNGKGPLVVPSNSNSSSAASSDTSSQVWGHGSPVAPSSPSSSPAASSPSLGKAAQTGPDSCGKFAPNATTVIQKAQTDANRVLQDLAQNVTSGNGIPEVVAFTRSFNEVFNGILPGYDMTTVCNVTVPTIEQAEAAAKAQKIQPTYQLRVTQEQAIQQHILLSLQKVAQDVVSCNQPAAIADYCKIAQWYYQAPPKPSSTVSAH